MWDQGAKGWVGEKGDSPYPLGVFPPDMPLDWVSDGVKDEDTSFVLLDAIQEDFHWVNKGKRLKIKGRRELQNLESFINYGDTSVPLGVEKERLRFCSVECSLLVSSFRVGLCGFVWAFLLLL